MLIGVRVIHNALIPPIFFSLSLSLLPPSPQDVNTPTKGAEVKISSSSSEALVVDIATEEDTPPPEQQQQAPSEEKREEDEERDEVREREVAEETKLPAVETSPKRRSSEVLEVEPRRQSLNFMVVGATSGGGMAGGDEREMEGEGEEREGEEGGEAGEDEREEEGVGDGGSDVIGPLVVELSGEEEGGGEEERGSEGGGKGAEGEREGGGEEGEVGGGEETRGLEPVPTESGQNALEKGQPPQSEREETDSHVGAGQLPPKPMPVLNGNTFTSPSDLATPPDHTPHMGADTGRGASSSTSTLSNGIATVETHDRLEVTDKDGSVYVRIDPPAVSGGEEGQRTETGSCPEGGRGTGGGVSVVGKGGGGGGGQRISLTNDLLYDLD